MLKDSFVKVGDATSLSLPDNCIHLVVTSPPYNVKIDYGKYIDDVSATEYEIFTEKWIRDVKRVLVPGGRACINVGNMGRKPYEALNKLVMHIAVDKLQMLQRGEIIWVKPTSVCRGSTKWGSYLDCTNPVIRDCHEYIDVFSKEDYYLNCKCFPKHDITKKEFSDNTISVWEIPPVKVKGHPVPFPFELARRCIVLYSRPGMWVLDPFCGSGQALIAAMLYKRKYVGFDIDEDYVILAKKRLELLSYMQQKVI